MKHKFKTIIFSSIIFPISIPLLFKYINKSNFAVTLITDVADNICRTNFKGKQQQSYLLSYV